MNEEILSSNPSLPFLTATFNHPLWTCLVILFWYAISTGIILLTKWLFTAHFPYPLTVTAYSNSIATVWAGLLTGACGAKRAPLTRDLFLNYVAPIGVMTALEIGCSNLALNILTVSFGTILKGVAPVFTFAWGLLLGVERLSWRVGASLVLISVGIACASLGEGQEFPLTGFCLQVGASALGGLRWAMTHKLLKNGAVSTSSFHNNDKNNGDGGGAADDTAKDEAAKPLSPLTAILYTSPLTAICVLPFALLLEWNLIFEAKHDANAMNSTQLSLSDNSTEPGSTTPVGTNEATVVLSTMTLIATLVFVLLVSEYWLVKVTSSLALSVAGVFKELVTIAGGIFFFGETVGFLNVFGFVTCQVGILAYVFLRMNSRAMLSYALVEDVSSYPGGRAD